MKFLAVFACALAFASAGHLVEEFPVHGAHHYGAQHLPVIGPNGVPVNTPAVQQATAEHLAYKAEAYARNGDYHHDVHHPVYHHEHHAVPDHHFTHVAAKHEAYPTTVGVPAVTGDGVPLETPEVVAAKSAHFAAHGEALARTAHVAAHDHHHFAKRGIYTPTYYTTPVTHHNYGYGVYGHHFLAKRGIYTPSFYTPYTHHTTYPYGHYY